MRSGEHRWSAPQYALFGLDPDGGPPDRPAWRRLVHPEGRQRLEAACATPPAFGAEFRIRRAVDGADRWIASAGRIEVNADGRPIRMLGISRDITEEREGAAGLMRREAALRTMVQAHPIGVLRGDVHGHIHDAKWRLAEPHRP